MSISIALDRSRAPLPLSKEELSAEISRLRMTCQLLEKEIARARAITEANNARCTIMKHAESAARAELLSKNSKNSRTRRAIKRTVHYVAHDTVEPVEEIHAAQAQEKAQRPREMAKKEVQKAEEEAAREARIREETQTRIFTGA